MSCKIGESLKLTLCELYMKKAFELKRKDLDTIKGFYQKSKIENFDMLFKVPLTNSEILHKFHIPEQKIEEIEPQNDSTVEIIVDLKDKKYSNIPALLDHSNQTDITVFSNYYHYLCFLYAVYEGKIKAQPDIEKQVIYAALQTLMMIYKSQLEQTKINLSYYKIDDYDAVYKKLEQLNLHYQRLIQGQAYVSLGSAIPLCVILFLTIPVFFSMSSTSVAFGLSVAGLSVFLFSVFAFNVTMGIFRTLNRNEKKLIESSKPDFKDEDLFYATQYQQSQKDLITCTTDIENLEKDTGLLEKPKLLKSDLSKYSCFARLPLKDDEEVTLESLLRVS